jgi:hypothetical protein
MWLFLKDGFGTVLLADALAVLIPGAHARRCALCVFSTSFSCGWSGFILLEWEDGWRAQSRPERQRRAAHA